MKDRIAEMLSEIRSVMRHHLSKDNDDSVIKLTSLLSRVQQLQKRAAEIEGEVSEVEATLKGLKGKSTSETVAELVPQFSNGEDDFSATGRAGPQTLRIEIDWKANGLNRDKEIILQPMAADSMVVFLTRLVEQRGEDALHKLSRFKISRGFLLSKAPATDFMNRTQGKVYAHKRLPGTNYSVLTHSQTSQKVEDLKRICRVLGLLPGTVDIRAVARSESYEALYA